MITAHADLLLIPLNTASFHPEWLDLAGFPWLGLEREMDRERDRGDQGQRDRPAEDGEDP
jgi:hypothetical protein